MSVKKINVFKCVNDYLFIYFALQDNLINLEKNQKLFGIFSVAASKAIYKETA